MIDALIIVGAALAYLIGLFVVAWLGDRRGGPRTPIQGRPFVYALSLGVYCTSWTFFGSVGVAAKDGIGFLPIYIGPIIMLVGCWPLLIKVKRIAKSQNITSIADFIAARYGKSPLLAALVTVIAVISSLPYIAVQLKAVALAIEALIGQTESQFLNFSAIPFGAIAFLIAAVMALFAVMFGTRHIDATEHQPGLMLAIAAESVVKLATFLVVGGFVVWGMFGGIEAFWDRVSRSPQFAHQFDRPSDISRWVAMTTLSFCCILLLPRQFHVAIVENNTEKEIRRARWAFPIYLVLINLFVVPIAVAGLLVFQNSQVDADMFVLLLPLAANMPLIAMLAFIGGLSAATAMVIVESVALAIMVSNDLVLPLLLRLRRRSAPFDKSSRMNIAKVLLIVRRCTIVLIIISGYGVYNAFSQVQGLAAMGLLSFAAFAQLAPAFFGGLFWRAANARGAIAAISLGFAVWSYTLLLPWVAKAGWISSAILATGPFGIGMLNPEHLFGLSLEPLTHGVFWSLSCNVAAYYIGSISRKAKPIERMQANVFVDNELPHASPMPAFSLWRIAVTQGDLQRTVARYMGAERAERSFREFEYKRGAPLQPQAEADLPTLRFAENLLASAIGASSSRLVLALLLRRQHAGSQSALRLLDDASEALHYNRDLLQTTLDQVLQGIAVFDTDMRLICWNQRFLYLLGLPSELGRVGVPLNRILLFCAERGDFGAGPLDQLVSDRIRRLAVAKEAYAEHLHWSPRRVLDVRPNSMPQGGIVTTYADITERIEAQETLSRVNNELERRVDERTRELIEIARQLSDAKTLADRASLDKTRFLAAASHDILQPLNAARIYTTSLVERGLTGPQAQLARNVDTSLGAVEEILNALTEISKLDSGRFEPEFTAIPLNKIFEQLVIEFAPAALAKGLQLKVVPTKFWVRSDRRMLRRILQNLVSNAIKYTDSGKVLLGARMRACHVIVQVYDTGPGIPADQHRLIFHEFHRVESTARSARGLGLGLSIVERIARMLGHAVRVDSAPERGSIFSVVMPISEPQAETPRQPAETRAVGGPIAGFVTLCIDNEPAILDSMRALLTGWGCHVILATSPEDAVAAVRKAGTLPDIILADYHLQSSTGLDAIAAVRALIGGDTPACIITADYSTELHRSLRLMGLTVLRKPLKTAALRAVLSQISLRRAAAE